MIINQCLSIRRLFILIVLFIIALLCFNFSTFYLITTSNIDQLNNVNKNNENELKQFANYIPLFNYESVNSLDQIKGNEKVNFNFNLIQKKNSRSKTTCS